MTPIDPLVRFYGLTRPEGDCLLWTGTNSRGYGYFQASTRKETSKVRAARWIYEQEVGPIPDGHEVDHVRERGCIGKKCVKSSHLEAVTHEENMRRARLKMCRSGKHDLDIPENVRWDSEGRRRGCLRCWLDRAKERYHAKKENA